MNFYSDRVNFGISDILYKCMAALNRSDHRWVARNYEVIVSHDGEHCGPNGEQYDQFIISRLACFEIIIRIEINPDRYCVYEVMGDEARARHFLENATPKFVPG